ncbi:MAG: UDP-N-acetylglucosamine 1-carboxyvinyltransferase [Clostridia bacterium]|nr:UDP-N-acetylglucosamine 1-carboxyvinyltransferase [Clostridia bacterium]
MSVIVVEGGHSLEGTIRVHGAKNAVLPILAATVLSGGKSDVENCPALRDVAATVRILEHLGCSVRREGATISVDSSAMQRSDIPECLMREMRSSVIFLGAILARFGTASVAMPGGCELGPRPIDLHLSAFAQMGVNIREAHGIIHCECPKLHGAAIHLAFPSVGATENVMLAASLAEGTTVITNAAKEPEIEDLQIYLNRMGARVQGAGSDTIRIDGVSRLYGAPHRVIPDRIVAATYMACSAVTGGTVELTDVCPKHLEAIMAVAREYGAELIVEENRIIHRAPQRLRAVKMIRTMPYPGFPTDAQAPMMAALCYADGTGIFTETIFENRFKHVTELTRMGADITVEGRIAVVRGVPQLGGANMCAMELRGGAALVVAALGAQGVSRIGRVHFIERGYENLTEALSGLGAKIRKETEDEQREKKTHIVCP